MDANVSDELRSWKVPENEFTVDQKVTLRRILSHSAGTTVHGYSGYTPGDPLPTTVQILDGAKPAKSPAVRVDTVPRTVYRYSGGGMIIMQLMMTEATAKNFPAPMHDVVLGRSACLTARTNSLCPRTSAGSSPYLSGSYSIGLIYHFTIASPVELLPERLSQFFTLTTGDTSFRFEENADGVVDRCIVISGANQREARKDS